MLNCIVHEAWRNGAEVVENNACVFADFIWIGS